MAMIKRRVTVTDEAERMRKDAAARWLAGPEAKKRQQQLDADAQLATRRAKRKARKKDRH